MRFAIFAALAAMSALTGEAAVAQASNSITVDHAWAGAMSPGAQTGAGYAVITNAGAADRLVSVSSPRASMVTLHDMHMEGTTMVMRDLTAGMVVPAHGALRLTPAGAHIMFMGVRQPFAMGQTIPVTLHFEHAGAVTVSLPVSNTMGGH